MLRSIALYLWYTVIPAVGAFCAWYAFSSDMPSWQQSYLMISGVTLTAVALTEALTPMLSGPRPTHDGSLRWVPLVATAINVGMVAENVNSVQAWAVLGLAISVMLVTVAINRMPPIEGDPQEYRDMGRKTPSRDRT